MNLRRSAGRMNFKTYQSEALATDHGGDDGGPDPLIAPLRGLSGEVVSLLSEYKKWLATGEPYGVLTDQVAEDMGDVLWYLSNLASKLDLDLERIANENLAKR